jgi:hypothetical protein
MMKQCDHRNMKPPCAGHVEDNKYGRLCQQHTYTAWLRERCGQSAHDDGYGSKFEDVDKLDMFSMEANDND